MIKPVENIFQGKHLNGNPEEPFLRLSGYPETFRNHSWYFPVVRKPSGTIPGTFRLSGNLQEPFPTFYNATSQMFDPDIT
ncbi:MAG: hypothetical protein V5A59_01190 [Bacteroidales bacterium]